MLLRALSACLLSITLGATYQAQAALLTVTSLANSGAGSLRAQIAAATEGDTIDFDATLFSTPQTINTNSMLAVGKALTINGPGARLLTVRRGNTGRFGIFTVDTPGTVRLSGMTISNGNALSLASGVTCRNASLTLAGVTLSGNGGTESAFANIDGTATIQGCTISNNTVIGVFVGGGTTNIVNSTISGNDDRNNLGGVYGADGGVVNFSNSTITDNTPVGIYNGGIPFNIRNSIIAGNLTARSGGTPRDITGEFTSQGNNLIGTTTGGSGFTQPSDKTNIAANIGVLADNGGPTDTHTLLEGSPAIDAGSNAGIPGGVTTDGRGAGFPRIQSDSVDIGAVEPLPFFAIKGFTPPDGWPGRSVTINGTGFLGTTSVTFDGGGGTLAVNPIVNATGTAITVTVPAGATTGTISVTKPGATATSTAVFTILNIDPAALVVTTLSDSSTSSDGLISLREAITSANSGDAGTAPEITFNVTGTITLTPGSFIPITKSVTITGPGAELLSISGSRQTRMFRISSGVVGISGLTLTNGSANSESGNGGNVSRGGAIYLAGGDLTVASCVLSNSSAIEGGGIYLNSGSLTVLNSTVSGNSAASGGGGGIRVEGGSVVVTGCTVSGNTTTGVGGGVYLSSATVTGTVSNSTVSSNRATAQYGGGGGFFNLGNLTIRQSTISGNTATASGNSLTDGGGGIFNYGALSISASTITANTALNGGAVYTANQPLNLSNTIVAGNSATRGPDINGAVTAGDYNLVQNTSGTTLPGTHNITGQSPLLGALANNGGSTRTHSLPGNSPAINAGDPAFDATNTPDDQRGFPRLQSGRVDIGAFESETPQSGGSFIVTTLDDHDDGIAGPIDCTLREAIRYAPAGTIITFAGTGFIKLTLGELLIDRSLTVQGPTTAPGITVSGNGASRIFTINTGTVNLSLLTLSGGNGVGPGSSGRGGAVVTAGGVVTIANTTFSGNSAATNGGAIYNLGNASLSIVNCTFSGNSASTNGGAIRNIGSLTIANSTFSGNSAPTGGGIHNSTSQLNLSNTIVAGNSATNSPDLFGTVVSGDHNLVQDISGATLSGTNNITGQSAGLDTLKSSNGGPTATMALLAGSPALDAGSNALILSGVTTDQRGVPRIQSGTVDIGAWEMDFTPPAISISAPSVTLAVPGSSVTYTVTYADANFSSSTLSAGDVTLNRAGTINAAVSVTSGSVTTRTVTLSGISGYGTLGISIAAGTAVDSSGNTAPAAGPSSTFTVNPSAETVQGSATIRAAEGGGYEVGFIGNPGQEYTIQFSTDLTPGSWQTLLTRVADLSGVISIVDGPPFGTAKRFYRVLLP